ncbi:MAG: methyltransferase domain-containing protein [Methanomicrobiales archaeon]|nr:methyltransferase domain-containing protein [Methanomicrobiales archaeon]
MKPTAGSTADEVLAVALQKLALPRAGIFADIGCGSGKVSIAASPLVREVYAIDSRPESIAYAREQARAAGVGNPAKAGRTTDMGDPMAVGNIVFLEGEAPGILDGRPAPDRAFIGGSRNISAVIEALAASGTGRMVVSCVRIETLNEAVAAMRRLGIFREALLIQVARSRDLAGGTMFVPAHPVYLVIGGEEPCS